MPDQIIQEKIRRLTTGQRPRVLDLFSGCGGISLGFHRAGFEIVGAIEIDPHAARSHALNFHKGLTGEQFEKHASPRDITVLEPEEALKEWGLDGPVESQIDVIVGGPPCQAFARVGRAKLREVAEHPEAYLQDPRSNLYLRYLHYVRQLRPLAILMENVPDILNYGGHNIAEEVCEVLGDLGYALGYTLLNSVHYGVPEMRERMFLVGYLRDVAVDVVFPPATHFFELPKGYHGTREVALKTVQKDLFRTNSFFKPTPEPNPNNALSAVTAREALGDLPPITLHLEGRLTRGARRFDELVLYPPGNCKLSPYAELMRTWPSFENDRGVCDHVIRYLPRDYAIFRRMNPGDQYPEAHRHAMDLLHEKLGALEADGRKVLKGTAEYNRLLAETVPPYDPGKFPNKWRKMEDDQPSRTLMAHLGKDSYSHIHYDSAQARTISVREAARLQSFPDGFVYSGTMNPAFRQIGNAVPPLLAFAIAMNIMNQLRERSNEETGIEEAHGF